MSIIRVADWCCQKPGLRRAHDSRVVKNTSERGAQRLHALTAHVLLAYSARVRFCCDSERARIRGDAPAYCSISGRDASTAPASIVEQLRTNRQEFLYEIKQMEKEVHDYLQRLPEPEHTGVA